MNTLELDLTLPFISGDLPGIGGSLRASTDHFIVEEIPLYEASGEGQHLYINITKEGLNTRDVEMGLARIFGIANRDVGIAGMKDKHARTTQTFSVSVGYVDEAFVQAAPARIAEKLPVTVNWARLHKNKLKRGHLLGNRFTVTITDLAVTPEEALARGQAIIGVLEERGLPNFYGPQRLGRDGMNVQRGMEILRTKQHVPDRWLRSLLLASVQSYLCNRYLARRIAEGSYDRLLLGDIAKKVDTGGLFEVTDVDAENPRHTAQEISFTAPMYGPDMWGASGPSGVLEAEVLAESGFTIEQMAKARLSGTRRMGRLRLTDLAVETSENGLVVGFFLPKGAFATTLLRELMKNDDGTLNAVPDEDD
ncbi:MAG: tRNA pseudouridine(13) synthase TruD [Caldilineaceae bacterium]|nr:tRNA pseudouridine(13) synthase TruD [Caldilineaceae bacterium]HRJ41712.1 tRNA pseudouridine(13) synthase TruD [Caldilineaceae bacterium]